LLPPLSPSAKNNNKKRQDGVDPVTPPHEPDPATFVISGAGIVGLFLALELQKATGVTPELYERTASFDADVGAGMGMYPNGLRAILDISPELLNQIRQEGYPDIYRRVERHDGSEVVTAREDVLHEGEEELESIGIRRWRLQNILHKAVSEAGIPVYFGKKTVNVTTCPDTGLVEIAFEDGTTRVMQILFGADGSRSKVRDLVTGNKSPELKYTCVTCLMGMADCARPERGHCTPSANTTKCHAVFFPTRENEQCFQFHFPVLQENADAGNWGTLSEEVGHAECRKLAEQLREEGWHEKYLEPLDVVTHALRIGFCLLEPKLDRWEFGGTAPQEGRVVLVGDAAHPPVPYAGQGAQMGLEDAATIAALVKELCEDKETGDFSVQHFGRAMEVYQQVRIPRTAEVQKHASALGKWQQRRADCKKYDKVQGQLVQRQVFFMRPFHKSSPESSMTTKTVSKRVSSNSEVSCPSDDALALINDYVHCLNIMDCTIINVQYTYRATML
jgi:2-polyprenyl-6-methoxyphenol hydroxylase-like FAD-dependent oxidoreductase